MALAPTAQAFGGGKRSAAPAEGAAAGLVPFETKRGASLYLSKHAIDLSKEAQARKRVNSLKRSVWASGHLHTIATTQKGFRPVVCWFVTLTYDTKGTLGNGSHDWHPNHIKSALEGYRNWCRQRALPCRYTWVAELQKKGTVHYHLIAWLPTGVSMPKWDLPWNTAKLGQSRPPFWPYGMTNTQECFTGVGYLMKYLSKLGELSCFPKGLRLYGVGGLDPQARTVRNWYNLPQWAKNAFGCGQLKRLGSRLVDSITGEIHKSPYITRITNGFLEILQVSPVVPRWHDGAYSSVSFS